MLKDGQRIQSFKKPELTFPSVLLSPAVPQLFSIFAKTLLIQTPFLVSMARCPSLSQEHKIKSNQNLFMEERGEGDPEVKPGKMWY